MLMDIGNSLHPTGLAVKSDRRLCCATAPHQGTSPRPDEQDPRACGRGMSLQGAVHTDEFSANGSPRTHAQLLL